ncbi:OmpP1/FadL family transporter [Pontibacter sp. 13R65]|uniref:OmpP1/FadL family transporter n=1 Tax=Pontibacter sp. 13R65 TaxID=3127458 RepID=UPI00301C7185
MLNKIVSASLALLLGWSGTAFAQSEVDALRYTRLGVSGSARIQGIGGAQSALGADISSMFVNPAGLGMFRRSEITISPGFSTANANSRIANPDTYFGPSVSDNRNSFGIPQAGIVFADRRGDNDGSDWRGTNIGLSITRLNNFNSQTAYNGNTQDWTIVDYFAEQANNRATMSNGRTLIKDDLDAEFNNYSTLEGMAYGTYLIDVYEDDDGEYAAPVDRALDVSFGEEVLRKGSQNQFDIGVGTSYRDKIYLGASVGIVSTNYSQVRMYRESDADPSTTFNNMQLRDEFTTRGAGINLKLGAIFRPVDALRIGASVQTPTSYSFDETYATSLNANFSDIGNQNAVQAPGQFSYGLTTPFRATGGIAYFLNKLGFISADVEYVNYAGARFRERDSDFGGSGNYFGNINTRIRETYQSAVNIRVGAEARYEVFRFRAGYAHGGDPYKGAELDGSTSTISLGTGVRLQNYFVDVAYTSTSMQSAYSPYSFNTGVSPQINTDNRLNNVVFTVGFNF